MRLAVLFLVLAFIVVIIWGTSVIMLSNGFVSKENWEEPPRYVEIPLDNSIVVPARGPGSDVAAVRQSSAHQMLLDTLYNEIKKLEEAEDKFVSISQQIYNGTESYKDVINLSVSDMRKAFAGQEFNAWASDRLPFNRTIPDVRPAGCPPSTAYDATTLPATAIIFTIVNELPSTLLRSIASIIHRSPPTLIAEIIVVDDYSLEEFQPMYKRIAAIPKVRWFRNEKREGLIRSRVRGAEMARAPVLTFLDSHIEVNKDWIQPMLKRVAESPRTVVTPEIDMIGDETFQYTKVSGQTGGFRWDLVFTWDANSAKFGVDPVPTPTIAGGLFTINRQWFFDSGTYDEGMDIWGGENLEMSFRMWMCGGGLEIHPCSHVGHIFRKKFPYDFPTKQHSPSENSFRVAYVWMDEFKEQFFLHNHHFFRDKVPPNIEGRIRLRESLNCTSFKDYLDKVYPDKYYPEYDALKEKGGQMRTHAGCVDAGVLDGNHVGVFPCHGEGGNQLWHYDHDIGEIKRKTRKKSLCLDAASPNFKVTLEVCHGLQGNQQWSVQGERIVHVSSSKCLQYDRKEKQHLLSVGPCTFQAHQTVMFESLQDKPV